jgi:hypothetical protein
MDENTLNNDDAIVPEIENCINQNNEEYIINTLNEYYYNLEQNILSINIQIVPDIDEDDVI